MELLDIYDENNRPLSITKNRRKVHLDGDWHRTSQIWILNKKGDILCNLRSSGKDLFPLYWDLSIGGHVKSGDSYETTAQRELEEELGIQVRNSDLKFLADEKVDGIDVENKLIDREHARLFLYYTDKECTDFKYQREEIDKLIFVSPDDLLKKISDKGENFKIVPIKKHYQKIIEQLKGISKNEGFKK